MKTIQLQSKVGTDGVLNLQVPIGHEEAGHRVVVTIEPAPSTENVSINDASEWSRFVKETYGSCAGLGLERQPQGELETREPLE